MDLEPHLAQIQRLKVEVCALCLLRELSYLANVLIRLLRHYSRLSGFAPASVRCASRITGASTMRPSRLKTPPPAAS